VEQQILRSTVSVSRSLTHDDLVDALAYIDQLAKVAYHYDFEIDNHEVLDIVSGY